MLYITCLVVDKSMVVWFPFSENIRNVIVYYGISSDKKFSGKTVLRVSFKSPGKKDFEDSVVQNLSKGKSVFLLYESMVGWDSVYIKSSIYGSGFKISKSDTLAGFNRTKSSSLILAHNISRYDSSAIFKRENLYIRACFECVFYGEMKYYVEVLSDSTFIFTGAILKGEDVVLRIPPKTYESSSTIYSSVSLEGLDEGKYTFVVDIISPSYAEKITLKRDFYVSMFGDDISSFIDYIATPEEKREFEKILSVEARLKFLKRFWEKRGLEFYVGFRKRVIYADSAFSTPALRGRYTDMGRIYIKRGKPDEITSVEMGISDKPYIRWVYYSGGGYDYIFGDLTGTGEYVLIKTNDPEEARFSRPSSQPSLDINRETHWEW